MTAHRTGDPMIRMNRVCPACGDDIDDEHHALCAPRLLHIIVQLRLRLALDQPVGTR